VNGGVTVDCYDTGYWFFTRPIGIVVRTASLARLTGFKLAVTGRY